MRKWKVGDKYWAYEDGKKLYGTIVDIDEEGRCRIEWSDKTATVEKKPDPAGDWLRMHESEDCMLKEHFEKEVVPAMLEQIDSDQERWGDTWKHRPIDGQEARILARFQDYFDQHRNAGTPIPWLKIIGECNIALAREAHPEWLEEIRK